MTAHGPALIAKAAVAARGVRIGPFGPNTAEIIGRGGFTHMTSSEAEEVARAVLNAVGPHLEAGALEEAAEWLDGDEFVRPDHSAYIPEHLWNDSVADCAGALHELAAEIRAGAS